MGIRKRRPNGKKIVELRQQKGLKQNGLAREAGVSERLLRDIERTNKPVSATIITQIATVLGVTGPEITLSTPDETLNASASLLRLRPVRATELNSLASSAHQYEWDLKADPSEATAEDMRQVMTILRRLVEGRHERSEDEFDGVPFSTIPRLARLQELLEKLRANGVGVLAGSYVQNSVINKELSTAVIICVHFVPSEVDEEVIRLPPQPSLDDAEIPF
jgi:transcriptional regulator with XRE-family HTH domain